MKALVTLLPDRISEMVHLIWHELERDFNFRSVLVTPYPRFTYCFVEDSTEGLYEKIEATIKNVDSFTVRTEYLGVFSGESPVVYIGIARIPELSHFHDTLWRRFFDPERDIHDLYGIAHWIPHITLIFGRDLNRENFCPVMERLVFRDFHREFEVNNLAILSGSLEGGIEIEKIFYFRGKHTPDR